VVLPDGVRSQIEGGIVQGLSAAMGEAAGIAQGRAADRNFDTYPLLRISQAPERIEAIIIESGRRWAGWASRRCHDRAGGRERARGAHGQADPRAAAVAAPLRLTPAGVAAMHDARPPAAALAGVVLAAGGARRMGGRPKALIERDGAWRWCGACARAARRRRARRRRGARARAERCDPPSTGWRCAAR